MSETLERRLGVFSATTLIVGSMIGSGIFIAPSIMAGLIATPGIYLGLWLVGGALTLLGARRIALELLEIVGAAETANQERGEQR